MLRESQAAPLADQARPSDCNVIHSRYEEINFWFTEKYDYVGRLLKPGEKPTDYSDTEEEQSMGDKSKDD